LGGFSEDPGVASHYDEEKTDREAGAELFGRFPMLQVLIYDAAAKTRLPLQ